MTFVITDGELQSLERPSLPAIPTSIRLSGREFASYEHLWKVQPQVRTVVGFLARNLAQIGLHVFDRVSDTDRKRLADHPLARLLARPLPPEFKMTRYRLFNSLIHDLGIYDNAYWAKVKMAGQVGLVRLPPRQVTPIGKNWFAAEAYQVKGNRGKKEFPAAQVVHFFGYNPKDPRHGVSPIESLRRVLAEDFESGRNREQMWANSARMSGYLKRSASSAAWDDEARARFRDSWRSQYTGSGPQAGGTPILEDGMDFVAVSLKPNEAQYLETRKLTREEVAAAYFIPPPMVGILDHATFGNIEEQHKMLYQDTLGPWLKMLEEDIELQLLPDLDMSPTVYVEFNIGEKLKGSFEEQAKSIQSLVGRPVLTADEGRGLLNRNALGGDAARLATPLNLLLDGAYADGAEAPDNDAKSAPPIRSRTRRKAVAVLAKARAGASYERKANEVLSAFVSRQSSAVIAGIDAGDNWWDKDRWDDDLMSVLYALALEVTKVIGEKTAAELGFDEDEYDVDQTLHFLQAVAQRRSEAINAVTKSQIDEALQSDEPDVPAVFDDIQNRRVPAESSSSVSMFSGLATVEATKQLLGGKATKTWITGPNPRPSHAAMNGETVPVGEPFSNGLQWPGDYGDAAETANCNCAISVSAE